MQKETPVKPYDLHKMTGTYPYRQNPMSQPIIPSGSTNAMDYRRFKAELNIHLVSMGNYAEDVLTSYYAPLVADFISNGLAVAVMCSDNNTTMDMLQATIDAARRVMIMNGCVGGTYPNINKLTVYPINAELLLDVNYHDPGMWLLESGNNTPDIIISINATYTGKLLATVGDLLRTDINARIPAIIGDCTKAPTCIGFVRSIINTTICADTNARPYYFISYTEDCNGVLATDPISEATSHQWQTRRAAWTNNFITDEIFKLGAITMPEWADE